MNLIEAYDRLPLAWTSRADVFKLPTPARLYLARDCSAARDELLVRALAGEDVREEARPVKQLLRWATAQDI